MKLTKKMHADICHNVNNSLQVAKGNVELECKKDNVRLRKAINAMADIASYVKNLEIYTK